jgi:superoxide dismutase, Cu-Zn family
MLNYLDYFFIKKIKSMKPLPSIKTFSACFLIIATAATLSCNTNKTTTDKTITDSTMTDSMNMNANNSMGNMAMQNHAEAMLSGTYADTTVSGTVKFDSSADGKVKMTLDIMVPAKANQSVAVHIHENGDCGDTAMMAHGHWNPTNAQHGQWGSGSFHLGDIGNVTLDAQGNGHMEMETDLWSIGGSDANKNILNKSIIVHGGVDDYTSQPSGNAGTRIGCGVIK